jgi:integrase
LPVVLTRGEVDSVLRELTGTKRIVVSLLYGSGLRLLETLQLRVKDIDLVLREQAFRCYAREFIVEWSWLRGRAGSVWGQKTLFRMRRRRRSSPCGTRAGCITMR